MPAIPHLVQRDGSYHARLSVPHALRPIVGKTELWAGLSATDRRDASRKLPAALARLHTVLEAARAEAKAAHIQTQAPRPDQLLSPRQVALTHYSGELAIDNTGRNFGGYDAAWREVSAPIYADKLRRVASGSAPDEEANAVIGWAIDVFAANGNVKATFGSIEWRALARQLAAIQLEIEKQKDARDRGESGSPPTHALLAEKPPIAAKDDPLAARNLAPDSSKTLSEILPDYLKERGSSIQTQYDVKVTIRLFEECLEAKSLYQIVRADVRSFMRMLQDVPLNRTKRFPGLSIGEAIKANKLRSKPFPTLSAKTINTKTLAKLRAVLEWCFRNDLVPDNPAAGIGLNSVNDKSKPPRIPFAPGDLARIFSPEHFDTSKPLNENQWAMLAALYTGTRASELGQMRLDWVRHERGVLVLAIEGELKTAGSRRLIPVHSDLIQLGFEAYVAKLRATGESHLFPQWYAKAMSAKARAESRGNAIFNVYFARIVPRWFVRTVLPAAGIHDSRLTWHSFRHTFGTGLARAGVVRSVRGELMGHTDSSAHAGYIHDSTSIEQLRAAIEKLRFDGFTLGT